MMHMNRHVTLASLLAAALLAGCAQMPASMGGTKAAPAAHPRTEAAPHPAHVEPAPPPAPADPAQVALHDGIEAYNNGDYNGAIKKLAAPDIVKSSKANQLSAIKYTAFSYCLSNRARQCRQQFDRALKLDPAFELDTGEDSHPMWGPVFAKAKKAKVAPAKSQAR
jgi:hypothetical protein